MAQRHANADRDRALAMAAAPRGADAGPGEAGGGHRSARTSGPALGRADFVVLIWYRRNDPLGTFQYQTYDVRKGEYTGAVDDWIKLMREKHPSYLVRVHDGRSGSRARRHRAAQGRVGDPSRAADGRRAIRRLPRCTDADRPGAVRDSRPGLANQLGPRCPAGGDRSYLNPSGPSFPVPMPYPRPHP